MAYNAISKKWRMRNQDERISIFFKMNLLPLLLVSVRKKTLLKVKKAIFVLQLALFLTTIQVHAQQSDRTFIAKFLIEGGI